MKMEINFTIDKTDWLGFPKHHSENSKEYKRQKMIGMLSFPIGLSAVFLYFFFRNDVDSTVFIPVIILSLLWMFLYSKLFIKYVLRVQNRMIEEGDNSGLLGQHKIVLNDDGIFCTNPDSERKIKWAGIKKIEETEDYYFLYIAALSAIIIPKKQIGSALKELDGIIKSRLA
jgi:hypothetical protein